VVVGILGFLGKVPLPTPHHAVHLLSGIVALGVAFGGKGRYSVPFAKYFGALYILLAIAGYAGLMDLGPIALDLAHSANIHITVGVTGVLAALLTRAKRPQTTEKPKMAAAA
ncbi:MAG TPA: hypothetical protein VH744_08250, partial [Terriglobales bacterium]